MKNIYIANKKLNFIDLTIILISLFLISCGPSNSKPNSEEKVLVFGQLTYDRVPATEGGLDYTAIYSVPIRRTLVSAIEDSNGKIIENTYTDEFGNYSFSIAPSKTIKIAVYSQSKNPVIRIQDNFTADGDEFARYVMQSTAFTTGKGVNIQKDLNADSGFDQIENSLTNPRVAAPFAILDNCLQSADFFLANRNIDFPKLIVNWSESNSTSTIGTSKWTGFELYILGDANQDTDEYDQHVVVHEWGHYFESVIGRSDSIGGAHTDGDVLDPRVAFSEGWGNALSAMVLYPDSVYKDTRGLNQSMTGILFDIDENNYELSDNSDFKIGWFSENSVQSILYDLFDSELTSTSESWDGISSNSGTIYDIFAGEIKNAESLVTIFTFLNGFMIRNPSLASDVDKLLEKHEMEPVLDEYGSIENNDGGVSGSIPVYKTLALDSSVDLDFTASTGTNLLASIQYIKISEVSSKADITIEGGSSKNIKLVYQGEVLNSTSGIGTLSLTNINFEESKTYVIIVTNGSLPVKITVSLTKRN